MSGQGFYEDHEAQEILRLAASHDMPGGAVSREMLAKTAEELGISQEALRAAEEQYAREQKVEREEKEFRAKRRQGFYSDLVSYVLVNAFLLVINLITGPEDLWVVWPVLGWGLGLAFHAYSTFFKSSEEYQKEFQQWRARRSSVPPLSMDPIIEDSILRHGDGARLLVIKDVRDASGLDLRAAKQAVDEFYQRQGL